MEKIMIVRKDNKVTGVYTAVSEAESFAVLGSTVETVAVGDEASCQVGCNFYPRIITGINKAGRYWTLEVMYACTGADDKWKVDPNRNYKETYVLNSWGTWREKGSRCSTLRLGACRSEHFDD